MLYEELERRCREAEALLQAIHAGETDALDGLRGPLVVRLAEAEAREAHIKQVLLAIRNVNQLIVQETDRERMIARACENLTETMGYASAWIVLTRADGSVMLMAEQGYGDVFAAMRAQLAEGTHPMCLTQALASDTTVVIENPRRSCADCALAACYPEHAVLARRLAFRGVIYGMLAVSVPAHYARDAEEKSLFEEVAGDLAFALHKIELEGRREAAEREVVSILESISDAFFALDDHLVVTYFNAAAARQLGRDADEVIGKPLFEAFPEARGSIFEEKYRQAIATREPLCFETYFDIPPYQNWYEVRVYPRDEGISVYFMVITERKWAEEEREVALTLLRLLNESNSLHELMASVTTLMRDWSGCEAVGIRLRDGADYPYFETRGLPAEFVRAENHLCALDAAGEPACDDQGNPVLECMCGNVLCGRFDPALPFFTAQGSFWTNSTTALLATTDARDRQTRTRNRCHGEGYESVALIPICHGEQTLGLLQFNDPRTNRFTEADIALLERMAANLAIALTQRKVEAEVRESEHRFRSYVENASDIVYSLNPAGVFTYVSPNWSVFMGEPVEAAIGRSYALYVHPDDSHLCQAFLAQVLQGGDVQSVEYRVRRADGVWRWHVSTGSLVRDESGSVVSYVGIARDVTERKRAEEALRALAESGGREYGDIFRFLVRELAMSHGTRYAVLARVVPQDPDTAHTLAVWNGEQFMENFSYPLAGAPCQQVTAQGPCFYPRNLQHLFPDDRMLVDMGAESYWGTPLCDSAGEVLGILAILDDRPMEEDPQTLTLLNSFAARAATEIERMQAVEALRESEAKYRAIFENAPLGLFRSTPEGRFIEVNPALATLLGYRSPAEVVAEIHDIASQVYIRGEEQRSIVEIRLHSSEMKQYLNRYRRRDGSEFIANLYLKTVCDEDGRPLYLEGIVEDITERRKAEEALQASLSRFQAFFDNTAVGIAILDTSDPAHYLAVNDTLAAINGVPVAEHLGNTMANVLNPDAEQEIMVVLREIVRERQARMIEASGATVDGRLVHYTAYHFPLLQGDDEVTAIGAVVIDQTERRNAEEALRESEHKFSLAFLTSPYAITITRLTDGTLLEVNEAFLSQTGYSREEALASSTLALGIWVDEEDRARVLHQLLAGRPVLGHEYRFQTKSGEILYGLFSAQILEINGERCILASINNITERKRAEEERERLQGQLQQAQKMESVGRLAGGVAHDFNNMLGVILGHAELALMKVTPSHVIHDHLEAIRTAAERSADLTRQLLAFARKQTVTPRVLDLNDTLEGMLGMLRRLIGEDVDLLWMPGEGLWPVRVDPTQIDQIFTNLCVNARDAITGVGRVTIETANVVFDDVYCISHAEVPAGAYVMLAVSDSGCGMDRATQERLFEPFFTTKSLRQGTGLGLATVYGVVKQNGGFINVYSEPGQGTTFKIYLPRYCGDLAQSAHEVKTPTTRRGRETILLVEDEPAILDLGKAMLEQLGYTVLAASTPGEAIAIAEQQADEIHLLMTDVVMPEMNGRDLAKRLLETFPSLKRLFTSGYTANVIAHHGVLDAGVNFIQKPFTLQDLGEKVREALER
jgi:PAS domain S-box-containing protein